MVGTILVSRDRPSHHFDVFSSELLVRHLLVVVVSSGGIDALVDTLVLGHALDAIRFLTVVRSNRQTSFPPSSSATRGKSHGC